MWLCGDLHRPAEDLPAGRKCPHPQAADTDGGQAVPPQDGGLSGEGNPALCAGRSGEPAKAARGQRAA